uniref:polyhomeotic-like protein 3 n=1 Tax=Styela clava TaxID=7725 RepID=UPI001939A31E|nr:polyhomeotic-like protein 3 [Styela clava]
MKGIEYENQLMEIDESNFTNGDIENNRKTSILVDGRNRKKKDTNVLYHFIDGFVIEEADTPFTLDTGSLLTKQQLQDIWRKQQELIAKDREEERKLDRKSILPEETNEALLDTVHRCEYCGKRGKGHRSSRFCTLLCCRRYNIAVARRFRTKANKIDKDSNEESIEIQRQKNHHFSTPPLSPVIPYLPHVKDEDGQMVTLSPSKWTVDNVCDYISSLPDSESFAKDFRNQEIDGSALLLIKEDHLIGSLNIKLGPALKLCSHINKLQE